MENLFLLRPDAGGIENARNTGNRIDHGREPKLIGNAEERKNEEHGLDGENGKDQLPHIELTRTIARRFNERYAKKNPVFPEPDAILSDAPEIPGLDGQKMSKSRGNSIMLSATAAETAKLIKKSRTDSERKITFDPINRPEVSALLTTAALTTGRDPKEIAEEIGDSGAGALKMYVVESVNNFLAPMRERRAELAKDMDYVRDVLAEGNKKANAIANETLEQVRDAMGMRY